MTTSVELLAGLRSRGVELTICGDKLRYNAPRTLVTPDLLDLLREHKPELLRLLAEHPEDGGAHPAGNGVALGDRLQVTISGTTYVYSTRWDGTPLACPEGTLVLDTETEAIEDLHIRVPALALASASDGTTHTLVHPDDLAAFVLAHPDVRWVCHNAAFDFWVLERHLREHGHQEALDTWWRVADEDRLGDSMLLDGLLRLARNDSFPAPRNLEVVAKEYAGLEIDKADPYRMRYGELIGKPWPPGDRGFLDYAIKDAIATWPAYQEIRRQATTLANAHARIDLDVLQDARERFGLLTEAVQVRKAIALVVIQRNGMCLDLGRLVTGEAELRQRLVEAVAEVQTLCPGIYTVRPDGTVETTPTGQPQKSKGALGERLEEIAETLRQAEVLDGYIPTTEKTGKPTTAADFWGKFKDHDPFLTWWLTVEELSKELSFYAGLHTDKVHPKYTTLVRSGRTSCGQPNAQQVPREGDLRKAFVASPGYLLLEIDYKFIELVTLASICLRRYGKSILADIIRAGQDPHAHTAALMLGLEPTEFLSWEKDPPREKAYKKARQAAKAVNFGTPAGLGARTLVAYAKSTFNATLTEEEARQKREQLLIIYPEVVQYLAEDDCTILARNLKADLDAVRARERDWFKLGPVRKILATENPKKVDGDPFDAAYVERVWRTLAALNQDPELADDLANRRPSKELAARMSLSGVSTLTGRIRGGVTYTQARNTPFQGLAADGAALAMFSLIKAGFRVIGFVHDSFLIELPDLGGYVELATVHKAEALVCDAMHQVLGCDLPVLVESKLSKRWYTDAKLNIEGDRVYAWAPKGGEHFITLNTSATAEVPALKVPGTLAAAPRPMLPPMEAEPPAVMPGPCCKEIVRAVVNRKKAARAKRRVRSPLRWYGGKQAKAAWIMKNAPPDYTTFVDVLGGGAHVLFRHNREGVAEVYNDIHGNLVNFFRVLQCERTFERFRRVVEAVPLSEEEWEDAVEKLDDADPVTRAVAFFIFNRQSRAGEMEAFYNLGKKNTRRGMQREVSAWLTAVESLPDVHARLMRVALKCSDAFEVIQEFNVPEAWEYFDPPYLDETRASTGNYEYEWSDAQHHRLLGLAVNLKCKVMISGYPSKMYDQALKDWRRVTKQTVAHTGKAKKGKAKVAKIEVLWMNYDPGKRTPADPTPDGMERF
jgi:DNA adenine methylase